MNDTATFNKIAKIIDCSMDEYGYRNIANMLYSAGLVVPDRTVVDVIESGLHDGGSATDIARSLVDAGLTRNARTAPRTSDPWDDKIVDEGDRKVVAMFSDFLRIAGPPGPEAVQRLRRAGRQDLIDWAFAVQQETH